MDKNSLPLAVLLHTDHRGVISTSFPGSWGPQSRGPRWRRCHQEQLHLATRLLSGTFHLCCPLPGPALHCQGQAGPWRLLSSQGRRGSALLSWLSAGWRTWWFPFPWEHAAGPSPKDALGTNLSNTQPHQGSCHMLSEGRGSLTAQRSEVNWMLGQKQDPQAQQQSHFVGDTWFVSLDTWSTYLVTTVFWSILALRSSFCCWRTWIFSSRIMFFSAWKGCSVRRSLAGPSDRKETSALENYQEACFANYSV